MAGFLASTPVEVAPTTWTDGGASFCSRGTSHVLAYTSPLAGLKAMGTALVPRDGQISTSSPARKRLYISVSTGRPVVRSMCDAQLTLTKGCAAIGLQLVRSNTYMNPFLFA